MFLLDFSEPGTNDPLNSVLIYLQLHDFLFFNVLFLISLVLNIKTVSKVVAGGLTVVSTMEVLSRWSTFDQLVTAVNTCVLPAGTSLVNLTDGCVCLTVQAETLSALTTLWNLYEDGTLEKRLYNFFVTDEVKKRAGGETVEVNVSIDEEEFGKACRELISEARGNFSLTSFSILLKILFAKI